MFICEITGKSSNYGEKLNRLVVKTRQKVYTAVVPNYEKREFERVEVGTGFETVKELNASEEGVKLWNSWTEEQRARFLA